MENQDLKDPRERWEKWAHLDLQERVGQADLVGKPVKLDLWDQWDQAAHLD